jgi:hypothetical protein
MRAATLALALTLLLAPLLASAQFESLGAARREKKAAAKDAPAPAPAAEPPTPEPKAKPAAPAAAKKPAPTPPPPAEEEAPSDEDKALPTATVNADGKPRTDVSYVVAAKRGTYEPRTRTLTLEGVPPVVAATKVGDDGLRAVRRHKTGTVFGKDFKALWGGADAKVQGGLFASVGNRDDVTMIVSLSSPSYNANSGTLTFTATQVPPADGAATAGGVAEQMIQEIAKTGSWLRAVSRVSMADPVLVIDGRSA